MKKLLALVLALVMTLGLATVGANAKTFNDQELVDKSDFAEAIQVLAGMGVFRGNENGNFMPNDPIDRASTAAMIYRICTHDVTDKTSDIYAGYGQFTDLTKDWYKGYIGYCANGELIKGDGAGHFNPDDSVTGYQALAMVLRAIGYNKQNDFTGDDWELRVAEMAESLNLVRNISSTTLKAPASRALVAEILWEAINVPTATWTPALGYSRFLNSGVGATLTYNPTLGEREFGLYDIYLYTNDWGIPFWGYGYNTGDEATLFEYTALFENVKASEGCDIVAAKVPAGTNRIAADQHYVNGLAGVSPVTIVDSQADVHGASGRYIAFYKVPTANTYAAYTGDWVYREVEVDTYLAQVVDVTSEIKDANGHVIRDAYLTLDVFDGSHAVSTHNNGDPTNPYTAKANANGNQAVDAGWATRVAGTPFYTKDTSYALGDYVLVYVNANTAKTLTLKHALGQRTVEKVTVLDKAEVVEGAQKTIYWNTKQHDIEGKLYEDAVELHYDAAGRNLNVKMQWFLDQYGNIIGVAPIDRSNYAVLENIIWIQGTPGHAEATLRYFDGSTATKTVTSIDGWNGLWNGGGANELSYPNDQWLDAYDNAPAIITDEATVGFANDIQLGRNAAKLSTDSIRNFPFSGLALYLVSELDNGSVRLDGWETLDGNTNYDNGVDDTYVVYGGSNLTVGASGITRGAGTNNEAALIGVNGNTQFIYRTGTAATGFTYTTYTGTANLPAMAPSSATVFYVAGANGIASRVYVKQFTPAGTTGNTHLFVSTNNYSRTVAAVDGAGQNLYSMNVILNGEEATIVARRGIVELLAANEGKLFHATIDATINANGTTGARYGTVTQVTLVNETTDANLNGGTAADCNYMPANSFYAEGTITDPVGGRGNVGNAYFDVSGAKIYVWNEATHTTRQATPTELAALTVLVNGNNVVNLNKGLWVIYDNRGASVYKTASSVYVGKQLSDSLALVAGAYSDQAGSAAATASKLIGTGVNTATALTGNWPDYTGRIDVAIARDNNNAYMRYTAAPGATFATVAGTQTATWTTGYTDTYAVGFDPLTYVNTVYSTGDTPLTNQPAETNLVAGPDCEEILVTAEDGWTNCTYTIDADFAGAAATGLLNPIVVGATQNVYVPAESQETLNGAATPTLANNNIFSIPADRAAALAVGEANLRLKFTASDDATAIAVVHTDTALTTAASFTTALETQAVTDGDNAATIFDGTVNWTAVQNNDFIYVRVTYSDGTVTYHAFQLATDFVAITEGTYAEELDGTGTANATAGVQLFRDAAGTAAFTSGANAAAGTTLYVKLDNSGCVTARDFAIANGGVGTATPVTVPAGQTVYAPVIVPDGDAQINVTADNMFTVNWTNDLAAANTTVALDKTGTTTLTSGKAVKTGSTVYLVFDNTDANVVTGRGFTPSVTGGTNAGTKVTVPVATKGTDDGVSAITVDSKVTEIAVTSDTLRTVTVTDSTSSDLKVTLTDDKDAASIVGKKVADGVTVYVFVANKTDVSKAFTVKYDATGSTTLGAATTVANTAAGFTEITSAHSLTVAANTVETLKVEEA